MGSSNGENRLARAEKNEEAFKRHNERRAAFEERAGVEPDQPVPFACECDDPACAHAISVILADYERHAAPPDQFLVAPGHEDPDVEVTVEQRDAYVVVSKPDLKRPRRDRA
jgi:hypothetical protein